MARYGGSGATTRRGRAVVAVATVVAAIGVLLGASTAPAGAGPVTGIDSWETAVVALPNGGVAYDATRGTVLVAVAPSVPRLGNHLVEMDPRTGALGRAVAVGADPRALAVSDDGTRAYVGGLGTTYVTEVDLATFTVVRQILLGSETGPGESGGYYAEDIEVQPGDASVIAVARQNQGLSPRHEGVAIFDDGVQRAATTGDHTGANRITWSDDPTTLYGYNNETTGYEFFVLTVGAGGVTLTSPGEIFGGFHLDVEYAGGKVVATNGAVVDVETLALDGAYTTRGAVEVDQAEGVTYFVDDDTLASHDTATQVLVDSRPVPNVEPTDLVDAGTALVAAGPEAVLLLGEGVTAAGFSPPVPAESRVRTWGAVTLPIDAHQVAGSPDGTRAYAVVRQAAPQLAGRVVEISTATGAITRSLFVGADPRRIAVSADGSTLLVGHATANRLTEVATSDLSIRRTIALGNGELAIDIDARPGTSATFAVVLNDLCCDATRGGQILVQDGVVLPSRGSWSTDVSSAAFAADPDRLYGVNGSTTDFGFYTLGVGPTGLTNLSDVGRLSRRFSAEIVAADGLVYSTNGQIFDPTIPSVVGGMPSGRVVPMPAEDRLLVLGGSTILELDLDTQAPVATGSFVGGSVRQAVAAGATLAIATEGGKVVLVPVGDPEPAVTDVAPSSGPAAGGTTVTITGTALRGATAVRFGTSAAASFTVESDTTITAVTPPSDEGAVDVTVTTPGGTSSVQAAARFVYGSSALRSWVRAAYEDFLGRAPTETELDAAVARLGAGVARSTIAGELASSDEWIAHVVTGFYTDTLGRAPSSGEVTYWAGELRTGRRTVAQVAASFYASPEYYSGIGGGSAETWIADLFEKLLGRPARASDHEYWQAQVAARGRGWVALQMFQSLESRRARVTALYLELLGRSPDTAGRDYWAGRLTAEGDIALARSLAASPEYLARAGTRFP